MKITNDDWKPSLTDEEALKHYGVKGMRWGVRRSQAQLDRSAGRKAARKEKRASRSPEEKKERRKKVATASVVLVGAGAAALILKNEGSRQAAFKAAEKIAKNQVNSQKDRVMYMDSNVSRKGLDFLNSPEAEADLWQIDANWKQGFYDYNPNAGRQETKFNPYAGRDDQKLKK